MYNSNPLEDSWRDMGKSQDMQEFLELSWLAIRETANVNFPLDKDFNHSGDPITKA